MRDCTFYRVGKGINGFVKKILDTNPDYIVPVKKKGCKLLKYVKMFSEELSEKVRYRDYFENNDIDLKGAKISVVDDATKYTSMLCKYRAYFEEKGAVVDTYSYVGHDRLRNGEREQYDPKAYIQTYLEESTYQEYLNQQSKVFVHDSNFFDIDHLVVKYNVSNKEYEQFLGSLSKIGDIEFVNDVFTPKNIEKISIVNIDFYGAEALFNQYVSQGALQKIRMVYNLSTEELCIAPLSFPNWNSKEGNKENIFDKIPFEVPYENNNNITIEGIYFNIVYVFQMVLLKYFLNCISVVFDTHKFEILDWNLISYIGKARSAFVIKSASKFLCSNMRFEEKKNVNKERVIVPQKSIDPFYTIYDLMNELREHYNGLVNDAKTLMGVRYFLAYEEIIDRYKGNENIIRWIDILCDRGVLVTRNYCENGIFYRACRSGEADFDLLEKKSGDIVVIATNACGENYKEKDKWFCSISATYLNKALANFVYDYPSEEYECHTILRKPYNYGPLVYIQDKIDGNAALPLYSIDKISRFCAYDSAQKRFVSYSNKNKEVKEEISNRCGQHDDIPYTELTAYLGFLKYVKEKNGTDSFLNALSICRDQDTYFVHVYYNIIEAYRDLLTVRRNVIRTSVETYLRQAAALVNSAQTKLKFEQSKVKLCVEELKPDMVYEQAQQKIVDSFIPFDENFSREIIPTMKQIVNLEFLLVNTMLFDCVHEVKYWKKVFKQYLQQDIIKDDGFILLNDMISTYSLWTEVHYMQYEKLCSHIVDKCMGLIGNKLSYIQEKGYGKKEGTKGRRNKQRVVNNIVRHIWKQEYKNALVLFYTFSGYQNINDEKEADIVKKVQDVVVAKSEGGKLICGAEEAGYGVYITDSLENALVFANELLAISKCYSNVFFRFGCGYREVDYQNCKKDVDEILVEAQNAANKVKDRNVFIINKSSYHNIKKVENLDNIDLCKPLQKDNDEYYEYKGIDIMNQKIRKYDTNTDETIKIGIITVLPEEHTAMKVMLENKQNVEFPGRGIGNQFVLGDINAFDGGKHRVALARTSGDNNNRAAIRAAKMLEHFPKLEVIFMVGIAGGTPVLPGLYGDEVSNHLDKHVRLGDIVVSKGIFQYDYVKEREGSFVFKGENIPPCAKVVEAQQRLEEVLECDEEDVLPWNLYVKQALEQLKSNYERPDGSTDKLHDYNGNLIEHPTDDRRNNNYPKIFNGKIASSNTVLKNPEKRDMLKKEHDVYAIEMETSGIADTTWEVGIGYYGVRGICDYCDDFKNDIWHRYAALVAAAYTKALIEWMST